jgi:hypothetical protein
MQSLIPFKPEIGQQFELIHDEEDFLYKFRLIDIFRTAYRCEIFQISLPPEFKKNEFIDQKTEINRDNYLYYNLGELTFNRFVDAIITHFKNPSIQVILGNLIIHDNHDSIKNITSFFNAIFFLLPETKTVVVFNVSDLSYLTAYQFTAEEVNYFQKSKTLFLETTL